MFDEVVKTALLRPPGRLATALINLPAFIGKVALGAGSIWVARRVWLSAEALPTAIARFFAAGYFGADLAHWCVRSAYRRVLRTLEPALWDLMSPANPGRVLQGVPFHVIFWPVIIWPQCILAVLIAVAQLAVPIFLAAWLVVGRPAEITPEWTARRDLVLVISAAAVGALTNVYAIGLQIARYIKRAKKDEDA